MPSPKLRRIIGVLTGKADPRDPRTVRIITELQKPDSPASRLRQQVINEATMIYQMPPPPLVADFHELPPPARTDQMWHEMVEDRLAEHVTATRRHMQRHDPEIGKTHMVTSGELASVIAALQLPASALRSHEARKAAVMAAIQNLKLHGDVDSFNQAAQMWGESFVQSVNLLLWGK